MTKTEAHDFAKRWIDDWCVRDVDRIVGYFADGARFISPLAAKCTGNPVVVGHQALRDYWQVAHTFSTFHFTLESAIWDADSQILVIVYSRSLDDRRDRACEILSFDKSGKVVSGEAMYGIDQ